MQCCPPHQLLLLCTFIYDGPHEKVYLTLMWNEMTAEHIVLNGRSVSSSLLEWDGDQHLKPAPNCSRRGSGDVQSDRVFCGEQRAEPEGSQPHLWSLALGPKDKISNTSGWNEFPSSMSSQRGWAQPGLRHPNGSQSKGATSPELGQLKWFEYLVGVPS